MLDRKVRQFTDNYVVCHAGSYLNVDKIAEIMVLMDDQNSISLSRDLVNIINRTINNRFKKKTGWVEPVSDLTCNRCGKMYSIKYRDCYQDCALKFGEKVWEYLGEYQACCD